MSGTASNNDKNKPIYKTAVCPDLKKAVDQNGSGGTIEVDNSFVSSEEKIRYSLDKVYKALAEKGYNPVNQLVGYILSGDPTYITAHNGARAIINDIDRDELLRVLVKSYLNK